jgi:hypothetical protein
MDGYFVCSNIRAQHLLMPQSTTSQGVHSLDSLTFIDYLKVDTLFTFSCVFALSEHLCVLLQLCAMLTSTAVFEKARPQQFTHLHQHVGYTLRYKESQFYVSVKGRGN